MMPVSDAHPWPEMQRFDFLVRTRTLTAAEALGYEPCCEDEEPGHPDPRRQLNEKMLEDGLLLLGQIFRRWRQLRLRGGRTAGFLDHAVSYATGALSSVLDNAPAYANFFQLAAARTPGTLAAGATLAAPLLAEAPLPVLIAH